jgi:DNA-binding response OmpR family regulator
MLIGNRPRVLVVDDLADTADSLALLLTLWGYAAEACYKGDTVLEIARAYQPHVVLLDLALPRRNGFQVAQDLREEPGPWHPLLIAITGHEQKAYRIRAEEMGFYRYLVKPVDPRALQRLLLQAARQGAFPEAPQAAEAGFVPGALSKARIHKEGIPGRIGLSLMLTLALAGAAL